MLGTAGEIRTNSLAMFSYELLHMDTPLLADQLRLTLTNSVQTLDTILKDLPRGNTSGDG